jgi:hypothetical protein
MVMSDVVGEFKKALKSAVLQRYSFVKRITDILTLNVERIMKSSQRKREIKGYITGGENRLFTDKKFRRSAN